MGRTAATGGSGLSAAQAAELAAVKAKTDQLGFTKPGEVDANTQSMNDADVLGTGVPSDLWRGS